jgi:hypothetical protein
MALNPFFLQGSPGEQSLVQDLVNEHLRMFGIEVYYIPRKQLKTDNIIREVQSSKFNDNFILEAYLNNYEGYSPGSDIMSKFGISLRNELSLVISRERFEEFISPFLESIIAGEPNYSPGESLVFSTRPKEGDLIYFPLGERIFEIKHVEFENPFYQLGKNYVYELKCELFEYEDEEISTGVEEIESTLSDTGYITDLKLVAFGGAAKCEAIVSPYGGVNNIILTNDGYGYSGTPIVSISAPPDLGLDFGQILGTSELDGNSSRATAVAITTSVGGVRSISKILITNTGYGYSVAPTVTISGGGGTGAAAISSIATGIINKIQVTDKGDRYYTPPIITISPPVGVGITATATAKISSGRLSEVLLINAGSGYTSQPTITVSAPPIIGFGTYIISEEVVGSLSGTSAIVKYWNNPGKDIDKTLRVYLNSGTFSEGEVIVGSASSAVYTLKSYNLDTTNDKYSQNDEIESEADLIIDFSESNPFGTY